jgi:hypothetical protein
MLSQFGILGLIISSIIVVLPGLFLSIGFVKKRYGASVAWWASAKFFSFLWLQVSLLILSYLGCLLLVPSG